MNPVPFLWLAAVVGFLLLEASTFSMTSVWFAVGAAAALLTCLFTDSFRAQALVFIVVSILCLLAFRPLAAKLRQKITPTNGDRNLGREATVLTTVTADLPGRVRLDGVDWNARCATPGDILTPRAALPCDRTAQHPAHRGARIDRKPQSVICVLR